MAQRPEIMGIRLAQWGLLALAAILLPIGWALLASALRLSGRVRRVGIALLLVLVVGAAALMLLQGG